jgi:hypothetical protein
MLDNLLGADAAGQLAIYLNDHRAGAEGAEALARRSARSNADNVVGEYLGGQFLTELRDDRALLETLREQLGVLPNPAKQSAARLAELVGRAKLNGAVTGPTALGRVLELEALISGVASKRQLWCTATTLRDVDVALFEQRLARADDQLDRLRELHRWATREAFETVD